MMPPSNSRYMRSEIEMNGLVAAAIGYRAKFIKTLTLSVTNIKDKPGTKPRKRKEHHFEVSTLWGTTHAFVQKKSEQAAIEEVSPAFTEGNHDGELLKWLGRMAVHYDFEFTLKVVQKNGAHWVVTVTFEGKKKKFRSPVKKFPVSRPLSEAVVYVRKEIIDG